MTGSFDSRLLRVYGLRIAARSSGSGDPVMLLNGLSRPMEAWRFFADELRGRTVIAFDAPGVGASDTPAFPFSMPMLARVAASVLDAFGIDRSDVVGFSHGGAVAQQFAVDYPGRVGRLVLVSTSCGVGAIPGRRRDLSSALHGLRRETPWPRPDPVGVLWQIAAISTWTSIPVLGCIQAPTLVTCGRRDTIVPPANSRLLAARIPSAELCTIDAGHDLQRAGPAQELGRMVDEFLVSDSMFELQRPVSAID